MKVSVVIPTKDRDKDLIECIQSIANQTSLPKEVIVVDDGNITQATSTEILDTLNRKNVCFIYLKKDNAGTSMSRNLGVEKSSEDIIIILDDDVILDKDYIEELLKTYDQFQTDTPGGVGGIVKNERRKNYFERLFDFLFCMSSTRYEWDILPWGFPTYNYKISQIQKANFMTGGISSYKRNVLTEFKFREFKHGGRCANEDIDFFLRASKKYDFIVTPHAKVYHKQSPIGRESRFITGMKASFNRLDTFTVCADKTIKNSLCFCVAMIGTIFKKVFAVIFDKRRKISHLYEAIGMVVGVFRYFIKRE